MKSNKVFKTTVKLVVNIIAIGFIAIVLLFLALVIFEYRPDDIESLEVLAEEEPKSLSLDQTVKIVSWNIGYGALGDESDFFMDGGTKVNADSENEVRDNIAKISSQLKLISPDIILLQEVDEKSKRSKAVNEVQKIYYDLGSYEYAQTFACNYKVLYVPYPWPTMGQVNAGISTLSRFAIDEAQRISLPCPFKFPYRLCNLKRCLNLNRIPIENSDKELVVINLHLEAYDEGQGKAAQDAVLKQVIEDEIEKGNYVIAGGDFNQTFSGTDLTAYPQIDDEVWSPMLIDESEFEHVSFVADESTPTCRLLNKPYVNADKNNFQYYMLDGFIVSDNITVELVETKNLEFKNSDHNPVIMEFKLNSER